ncbi:MAG: hypothetical protein R3C56_18055 [Pirellulaceae bacterium]
MSPMTPQVAPHLQAQVKAATSDSDAPLPTTIPWNDRSIATDTPAANWPFSEPATAGTTVAAAPIILSDWSNRIDSPCQRDSPHRLRPLGSGNAELSLVLPVPADKLEIPTKVQPSRVAMVQQRSSREQPPAASDPVVDAPETPRSDHLR